MLKRSSKKFALMLVLTMLATMFVGVGTASAAAGYEALSIPAVSDDDSYALGSVLITARDGALKDGNSITLRLPSGFEFRNGAAVMTNADWVAGTFANKVSVPAAYAGDTNLLNPAALTVAKLADNEIQLTYDSTAGADIAGGVQYMIMLDMGDVYVDAGTTGDIILEATGPSTTGFPKGTVVVATAAGGELALSVTEDQTFSEDTNKATEPIKIRVQEDIKGDLTKASESLKFILPRGFEWATPVAGDFKLLWGTAGGAIGATKGAANAINIYADEEELIVEVNTESTAAIGFELTTAIKVTDESKAQTGDVVVQVGGSSKYNKNELTVGTYGQYGTSIKIDGDVPTIKAGVFEQEIADIVIKEDVKDSIIAGRTLTLELPSNVKWGKIDANGDTNKGLTIGAAGDISFVSDNGRTLKYKFSGGSTSAAELTLKDMEILTSPDAEGDIVVKVGGTAGLTGDLIVAKVAKSVSIKTDVVKDVKIGAVTEVGDVTITENASGAIKDNGDLILDLPEGVRFASTPKVEVTEGDLDITENAVRTISNTTDNNQLAIPIDSDSNRASTIKVSGIKLIADRSVPEGDIVIKVQGVTVAEVNDRESIRDYFGAANVTGSGAVTISGLDAFQIDEYSGTVGKIFPKTSTAASTVVAKVTTPAPVDMIANASFVIGSTTYTVNGITNTMDVAPYIKDARTYMPIRYIANAMGINDNNILWDATSQTVTLMKGDKVVQLKIGSTTIVINGAAVVMDVAPEITNSRTMLPARFVAQAFGANVGWDAATQTVTID